MEEAVASTSFLSPNFKSSNVTQAQHDEFMADPSKGDSGKPCQVSLPENSFSSQESTNCCGIQKHSSCNEIGETKIGSPPSMTPEYSAAAMQDETVPLLGKPYFTCILVKSNVQSPYQLVIPRQFTFLLPEDTVPVTLVYRDKVWKINYYGDKSLKRFDPGWRTFSVDNNLKVGDACLFELMDSNDLKFRVQILNGDIPVCSKGSNLDAPIVID